MVELFIIYTSGIDIDKNPNFILFSFRHSSLPVWCSGEKNITAAQVYFIEL